MSKRLVFPGAPGANVDTPGINHIDADTAHQIQGPGLAGNFNGASGYRVGAEVTPLYGATHGICDIAAGVTNYGVILGRAPVVEGETYIGSTGVALSDLAAGNVAPTTRLRIAWYDTGGGFIGYAGTIDHGPLTGELERYATSASVAPAGAATAGVVVQMPNAPGTIAGLKLYYDAVLVRLGTDPTFVPSLDIVGTLGETIDPAGMPIGYTPGSSLVVGDSWAGNGARYTRYDGAVGVGPIVADFDPNEIPGAGAISDGTTWQDSTGRTWTSHGALTLIDTVGPGATVTYDAVPAAVESGEPVAFTVTVENVSADGESFDLTELVDSEFGDLDGKGDIVLPQTVAHGATWVGTFTEPVAGFDGQVHTFTATATVVDPFDLTADFDGETSVTSIGPDLSDNALERLAEYLDDVLLDRIQIYGWAADSIKAPAIVLTPATPFQSPYTQQNWDSVVWGVNAELLVSRSQPRDSLRALYFLRRQVTAVLDGAPDSTRALAFDDIGTVTVGGNEYLQGTLTIAIIAKET